MLQPSTLKFLKDLDQNNHKEWFDANRKRYQTAREDFVDLVDRLIQEISGFDPGLFGLTAKACIFRINRDIRFSKDKSPYKNNFGASMTRGGRKSPWCGYYLFVQPGNSFLAGGCYHPESANLKKIRAHIEATAPDLRSILSSEGFQEYFDGLQGEELKTSPQGYTTDHPDIDLIRRKDFYVSTKVTDQQLKREDFVGMAADIFAEIQPLNRYFNEAMGLTETA